MLVAVVAASIPLAIRAGDGWASLSTAVLAIAFAWAAASKAVDIRGWRRTLEEHALPRGVESAATFAVPAAEAMVPLLVVAGWTRAAGVWALVLVAVFTAETVRAWRRFGTHVPCGCFGGREAVEPGPCCCATPPSRRSRSWSRLRPAPEPLIAWPGWPANGEFLPMVLVIAGLFLAGFTAWAAIKWLGRGAPT